MADLPLQCDFGLKVRSLNAAILNVHRAGCEVEFNGFQRMALEETQALIPFDSACWGDAAREPFELHHTRLFNCDASMLEAYRPSAQHNCVFAAMLAQPGVVVNLADLMTVAGACWKIGKHHAVDCALGTLCAKPVSSSLYEFLVLWRNDPKKPFSETERQGMELLMPHLMQAHQVARQRAIFKDTRKRKAVWGMADAWGFLHEVAPGFIHALRAHWPGWKGGQLPAALLECLRTGRPFHAKTIAIDITPRGEWCYLEVRAASALDRLSPRERDVAQRYASGETHSAIALALAISPTTVRNHLAQCFRKLSVSNKAELALLHFHKGAFGARRGD